MQEELKIINNELLSMQLALESYEDDMGLELPLISKAHTALAELRDKRVSLSLEEQLKKSKEVIDIYNSAFDLVGRENLVSIYLY